MRIGREFAVSGLALCLVASAVGCGKGLPKATDEQIAALGRTLDSASRVKASVPGEQAPRAPGASAVASVPGAGRFAALAWAGDLPSSESSDLETSRMAERLFREREAKHCDVRMSEPRLEDNGGFGLGIPQFDIHVTGDKCPVNLALSLQLQVGEQGMSASFACKYAVRDASYAELNDVTAMDMSGGLGVSGDLRRGEMSAKIDLRGSIHSREHGDVAVRITGEGEGSEESGEGEVVARFEYPAFTLELKQKIDGEDVEYFINDEEVSEREFMRAFGKTGLGGAVSAGGRGSAVRR